jgi:hypothetical protein
LVLLAASARFERNELVATKINKTMKKMIKLDESEILSAIDALNHYKMGLVTAKGLKEILQDLIKKI